MELQESRLGALLTFCQQQIEYQDEARLEKEYKKSVTNLSEAAQWQF